MTHSNAPGTDAAPQSEAIPSPLPAQADVVVVGAGAVVWELQCFSLENTPTSYVTYL